MKTVIILFIAITLALIGLFAVIEWGVARTRFKHRILTGNRLLVFNKKTGLYDQINFLGEKDNVKSKGRKQKNQN
jgi:hypothetical protein